ncbi:MAG: YdcF family protein [Limisphaerales bacterium]
MIFRAVLGFFLLCAVLAALGYFFPQDILTEDDGRVKADVIVVLGGGSHERPLRAAELFKHQDAPRIIISGEGDDEINRQLLLQSGVPAAVIQVEGKSMTTQENAEFTVKLLRVEKVHNVILVTSWYHSRRALKTFEHCAPDIKFYSRPSYFAFKRKGWTRAIKRYVYWEYVKLPGYWIRHGVCPF